MKAFKIDFDGEKFVKVSFDIKHEFDFSREPETKLAHEYDSHNCNEVAVDEHIARLNKNLCEALIEGIEPNSLIVRKCKDCSKFFIIDYPEHVWYMRRGMTTPMRCRSCRGKRKANKVNN